MKQQIILLIFLFPLFCFSQTAKITEYKKQGDGSPNDSVKIIYPVISTGNTSADNLISSCVIDSLTQSDASLRNKPLDVLFTSLIKDGMTDLNYNVTFN